MTKQGRSVHLVGSIPLASAKEVFSTVSEILPDITPRIPDGETGVRKDWILFQAEKLRSGSNVLVKGYRELPGGTKRPILDLPPGISADEVIFGPLGYAEAAIASYGQFKSLRDSGKIGSRTRFQVSLPTPLAPAQGFFERAAVPVAWASYEKCMLGEIDRIAASIPHDDLAIQWDVCYEFVRNLEPEKSFNQFTFDEMIAAIARVSIAIPEAAHLGYHLCYGDLGHKHVVDPRDTSLVVEVANRLSREVARPINWLHFPIPRERTDAEYFSPLRRLELDQNTEVYAGLIHLTDGIAGAKQRLEMASKVLPKFGVATECGFGRRPPETIRMLLELHREVAKLN